MLNRLSLIAAGAMLFGFTCSAGADPITYDFSGTLDPPSGVTSSAAAQADGIPSGPFTGSITFNDIAGQPVPGQPGEIDGPDVTASLNINGRSFQYANPSNVLAEPPGSAQVRVYTLPERRTRRLTSANSISGRSA